MSVDYLDYLPFNIQCCAQEIVPIWLQAKQGNIQPLRLLIDSADRFSLWPHINCPRFISAYDYDHFFVPRFREILAYYPYERPAQSVDLWDVLLPLVDTMENTAKYLQRDLQQMLLDCLLCTCCCDLPSYEEQDLVEVRGKSMVTSSLGSIIMGNEDIFLWRDYISYNEAQSVLWHPFRHPGIFLDALSPEEKKFMLAHFSEDDLYGGSAFHYRFAFITSDHFQEILEQDHYYQRLGFDRIIQPHFRRLYEDDHVDEGVILDSIVEFCVSRACEYQMPLDMSRMKRDESIDLSEGIFYDDVLEALTHFAPENERLLYDELVKEHPYLMLTLQSQYSNTLLNIVRTIKGRMAFAAERGWGLLVKR